MIESSIRNQLAKVLEHNRVYPGSIPMKETNEGTLAPVGVLPATSYRLLNGFQPDSFEGRRSFHTDTYLVEFFAKTAKECQEGRRLLIGAFPGPPNGALIQGGPAIWDKKTNDKIRWAEATDPTADSEFPTTDAHDVLQFVQLILTVTYIPNPEVPT